MHVADQRPAALFAAAVFALTPMSIYYATECKQYMCDILATLVLFEYVLRKRNNQIVLFAIGAVAMYLSNIAIVPLFLIGLHRLYTVVFQKKSWRDLWLLIGWAVLFAINYFAFVHDHPSRDYMLNYWDNRFMPSPLEGEAFITFILYAIGTTFRRIVDLDIYWLIPCGFAMYAIWLLFKRKQFLILYLFISPALVHLVLSALNLYPYAGRFILYLVPLITILAGVGWMHLVSISRVKWTWWVLVLLPFAYFYYATSLAIPIEREEIKKTMQFIQDNQMDSAEYYVYYDGKRAYRFYTQHGPYFTQAGGVRGTNGRKDAQKLIADLHALRGRTWLLFSHVHIADKPVGDEEAYMISYILQKGGQVIKSYKTTGSSAYLIDVASGLK